MYQHSLNNGRKTLHIAFKRSKLHSITSLGQLPNCWCATSMTVGRRFKPCLRPNTISNLFSCIHKQRPIISLSFGRSTRTPRLLSMWPRGRTKSSSMRYQLKNPAPRAHAHVHLLGYLTTWMNARLSALAKLIMCLGGHESPKTTIYVT